MRGILQEVNLVVDEKEVSRPNPSGLASDFNTSSKKDYYQIDSLTQLRANIAKVTELQFKMQFMLGEITSLVAKK